MPEPTVSVCVPARQAQRFIGDTLRSILRQTMDDFEMVVFDNACTDSTVDIVRSFDDPRIRLVHSEITLVIADSWNMAVRACRGKLIKLVCADDLLHPRCLELQVAAFAENPDLALVAARRNIVDENGRTLAWGCGLRGLLGYRDGNDIVRKVVRHGGNPIGEPAAALFRRDHFDAVSGFDGRLWFPMDLALWVSLVELGDFLGMRQALAGFRISGCSLSASASRNEYLEQCQFVAELANSRRWRVRGWDVAVGRLGAPLARMRREALFAIARHQSAR